MRFRVTGTNHSTGARMTLELEAGARAAAEQKARAAGMDVQHVAEIQEGPAAERRATTHRGEVGPITGVHPIVKTAVILAIIAVAIWFGWPAIRSKLGW
jgi:hypothetical protein